MPALIALSPGYGKRPFVCDSRCYDATGPDCACICGGMNHGKGFDVAFENVRQFHQSMIADLIIKEGLEENFIRTKMYDGQRLRKVKL